jgi:hypothetical protein
MTAQRKRVRLAPLDVNARTLRSEKCVDGKRRNDKGAERNGQPHKRSIRGCRGERSR